MLQPCRKAFEFLRIAARSESVGCWPVLFTDEFWNGGEAVTGVARFQVFAWAITGFKNRVIRFCAIVLRVRRTNLFEFDEQQWPNQSLLRHSPSTGDEQDSRSKRRPRCRGS